MIFGSICIELYRIWVHDEIQITHGRNAYNSCQSESACRTSPLPAVATVSRSKGEQKRTCEGVAILLKSYILLTLAMEIAIETLGNRNKLKQAPFCGTVIITTPD